MEKGTTEYINARLDEVLKLKVVLKCVGGRSRYSTYTQLHVMERVK